MKVLFFLLAFVFVHAQDTTTKTDDRLLIEFGVVSDYSTKIDHQKISFAFGLWYRYPKDFDARLELGGNIKTGNVYYNFIYEKNGTQYPVFSKGFNLNLGGRIVKDFRIKNKKMEWVSELTFNTLMFDGTGIPDDPIREPENENTTQIIIDAESISTLQFGQGLRIWNKNLGFGIKTSYTPYGLWYKNTVPGRFNVFSTEASILIKL